MEDQGIMALPQAGMQAPTAQPVAQPGQAEMAAFEQARMQVNPKEFGDSLLEEARSADPAAVDEFIQLLSTINLPPEAIDALGQIVDAILADPQNYPQIRADLLAEGVPEEILPEQFDPGFFAALNMALDQLSARSMAPEPQAFAKGGIVQLSPIAASLANEGRRGDRLLAHITHGEARLLRRRGGSGTINPKTGLPEFFLKDLARGLRNIGRGIGNAIKGLGKGIKKFASSTVGRVVTTVALGFFLGPAAAAAMGVSAPAAVAAMSGFVGGFGSSMLAGQSLKNSLKTGAIGALTAGVATGLTPGAFSPVAGGPTTFMEGLSQQADKFTGGIKSLLGGNVSQVPPSAAQVSPEAVPSVAEKVAQIQPEVVADSNVIRAPEMVATQPGAGVDVAGNAQGVGRVPGTPPPPPGATPEPNFLDTASKSLDTASKGIMDFYKAAPTQADLQAEAVKRGFESYAKAPPEVQKLIEKAASPAFGTGARLAGTGIGALALTGGFKQEPVKAPNIVPRKTGQELLAENPNLYGVTVGGAQTVYPRPMFLSNGGIAAVSPRRYALGGYAGGGKAQNFPRRTGPISGPGTETSDSIPAMLSDGEFVMTAKAVRGAGGGSRREGARRMYQMMRAFERKA